MDGSRIRHGLERLAASNVTIYFRESHGLKLNPPVSEAEVASFERTHGIRLPNDYREFLTTIGNGGAGPVYGVFPLGKDKPNFDLVDWREGEGLVGNLREPFPYTEAWNDLSGEDQEDEDDVIEWLDTFYYTSAHNHGAIPISTEGCAIWIYLVVTGPQAGFVWRDVRCEMNGLHPFLLKDGSRASFEGWYMEWLDDSLALLAAEEAGE